MKRLGVLRTSLPLVVLLGACTSILGIEDIHPGPKPGSDEGGAGSGATGTGGTSGGKATGGASGASGSTGTGGTGGSAGKGTSGTSGTSGAGGDSGTGGEGDQGGMGGTAGTGGTGDMTVRGRVITFWRTPMPNVLVHIGAADDVTNANGEFEIADVAPTYDAEFVVDYMLYNSPRTYAWAYQGLTRRDPTLMVYAGPIQEGTSDLSATGATAATNRFISWAFGMPGGSVTFTDEDDVTGYSQASLSWEGASTVTARVHGLVWDADADDVPTGYRSYVTQIEALNTTDNGDVSLALADNTVTQGTLGGTVSSATESDRSNYVYLRFTSNAQINLVTQYPYQITDPGTFSYVVPTIQNASLSVFASEGTSSSGPAGCAHKDGLAAGQLNVALQIPTPASLVSPSDMATTTPTTQFRWTGGNSVSVVHMQDIEPADFIRGVWIVTASDRVTVPTFGGDFELVSGAEHYWRIETHNDYADVDEAAGPEGFADTLGPDQCDGLTGPRQGDGSFAISGGRLFYPE